MAEDEMAVIEAIFCGHDEFELLSTANTSIKSSSSFRICVKCYHKQQEEAEPSGTRSKGPTEPITINTTFTLPSTYPMKIPDVSLSSSSLSRNVCHKLREDMLVYASTLQFEPMIMELVEWLKEHGSDYVADEVKNYVNEAKSKTKGDEIHVAVLHLDHMRSKIKYIKTLRKWAQELGLGGREFIVKLRTQKVDVDAGGRSCKERMMRVIVEEPHPSPQKRHYNFEVIDFTSVSKIEELFRDANLLDIYRTHLLPEFQLLR